MRELGDEVAGELQKCYRKVEDVLFDRNGLQVHPDSTASELLGFVDP